jgi:hypothetical protein
LVEAVSEIVGKLVKLIITVDFDGLFGGIHDHVAFVAPMEVFVQLYSQALADLAV